MCRLSPFLGCMRGGETFCRPLQHLLISSLFFDRNFFFAESGFLCCAGGSNDAATALLIYFKELCKVLKKSRYSFNTALNHVYFQKKEYGKWCPCSDVVRVLWLWERKSPSQPSHEDDPKDLGEDKDRGEGGSSGAAVLQLQRGRRGQVVAVGQPVKNFFFAKNQILGIKTQIWPKSTSPHPPQRWSGISQYVGGRVWARLKKI